MPEAVIVDAVRTPIGRAFKGSLMGVRADELAATPLRALVERNPEVDFAQTDDVMMGAASAVGEQAYNIGRNASLLAGIDHHVPACTVNRFCASSLQTLRMAFHAIRAGEGDQYIAAGVEAVSRAGLGAGHPRGGQAPAARRLGGLGLRRLHPDGPDGRERRRALQRHARGAGRVGADLADARRRRAGSPATSTARSSPVDAARRRREFTKDDGPRPGTTMEKLAALNPVFDPENGTVTAGNACPLNDGAAAVLVMSAREGGGARPQAARADHRLDRRRDPPGGHGPRPDPGDPGAARADRA